MFKNAEAFIHYPRCQLKMGTETTPRRSWRKYLERCLRLVDFEVSPHPHTTYLLLISILQTVYFFFLTHSIWGLLIFSIELVYGRKFYVHFPIFLHLDNTEVTGTSFSVFSIYTWEGIPLKKNCWLELFPLSKEKSQAASKSKCKPRKQSHLLKISIHREVTLCL